MKTVIYYFSGTGNSLAVARDVAAQLGNGEVRSIPQEMEAEHWKVDAEQVGFVFPLYYVGIPRIVQEFVNRMDLDKVETIFTVVTKGWPIVGGALSQMRFLLKAKGRRLDAGFYIQLPMNDITLVGVASPETQTKLLAEASAVIRRIAANIELKRRKFDLEPLWFLWRFRNNPFIARVREEDHYFSAEPSCVGCETCAKVCPVQDIAIENGNPRWLGQCEQCLACFHFCPKKAIRFNGRGGDQAQYHHPEVRLNELVTQSR